MGFAGSLTSPVACLCLVGLLSYPLKDRSPVHFSFYGGGDGRKAWWNCLPHLAAHVALRSLGDLSARAGVSFKRSFHK